jgi:NADH:ubiquinone oxidoreductase subunit 6 (subunit J)
MKILKALSMIFGLGAFFNAVRCVMLYRSTWLNISLSSLDRHNASLTFIVFLLGAVAATFLFIASKLQGIDQEECRLPFDEFLDFCPSWMRLILIGTLWSTFIHMMFCFAMRLGNSEIDMRIRNSEIDAIWRLRSSLGFNICFCICSCIFFYSIICSRKSA